MSSGFASARGIGRERSSLHSLHRLLLMSCASAFLWVLFSTSMLLDSSGYDGVRNSVFGGVHTAVSTFVVVVTPA